MSGSEVRVKPLACTLFLLTLAGNATAATRIWIGSADARWSVASNWSPAGTPQSGDDLEFRDSASTYRVMDNDLPSSMAIRNLTFDGAAWTVNGNALHVSGIGCLADVTFNIAVQGVEYVSGGKYNASFNLGANPLLVTYGSATVSQLSGAAQVNIDSRLIVSGAVAYSGTLNLRGGSLFLDGGSLLNATTTMTSAGGDIFGNGKVGSVAFNNGAIAPGTVDLHLEQFTYTPGRIDTGSLSFTNGGTFGVILAGLQPGSGYSQVNVAGSITLGSGAGAPQLIVNMPSGFSAAPGTQFVVMTNDGTDAVSGTFRCDGRIAAGYSCSSLAEGSTFMAGGIAFRITYHGGDGNDVVLGVLGSSATALQASPSSSVSGQSVTLTAAVNGSGAAPGGTVSFYDGAALLGTAAVSGGQAALTVPLRAGGHNLAAAYSGDLSYAASTSAALALNVAKANSTAGVTVAPASSVSGQNVTLTATLAAAAPGSGVPSGTVTFYDGATPLGTAAVNGGGIAVLQTNALAVGSGSVDAVYSGDAELNGSSAGAARNVGKASTFISTSLQASAVQVNVLAAPPGGGAPGGSVTLREGNSVLATAVLSAAGTAALPVPAGPHVFIVTYSGDARYLASAATVARDGGTPLVIVGDMDVPEGNERNEITIPIALSSPSSMTVTVEWSTADDTALAGRDYVAASGVATFAPGTTSATITVPILGNDVAEPDKAFWVVFGGAANAGVGSARVRVNLVNDDTVPPRRRAARH
jgi:hypothetical protein